MLADFHLYGIVDLGYVDKASLGQTAEAMIEGGVDVIQLRGKDASVDELSKLAEELNVITAAAEVPLVVNDYAEIACRVPVEGIHVGQDDNAIAFVRERVGRPIWVGKSTHSIDQAVAAQREGADYIGFGPLFQTPTKPDYIPIGLGDIRRVHDEVGLPIFCIGGIKLENLEQVVAAGAQRVVIVSGLLKAPDIAIYAKTAKQLLLASHASTSPSMA
jgi:thiamine-phosphate pyrophosphorylase